MITKPIDLIVANVMHDFAGACNAVQAVMRELQSAGIKQFPPLPDVNPSLARDMLCAISCGASMDDVFKALSAVGAPSSLDDIRDGLQAVKDRQTT